MLVSNEFERKPIDDIGLSILSSSIEFIFPQSTNASTIRKYQKYRRQKRLESELLRQLKEQQELDEIEETDTFIENSDEELVIDNNKEFEEMFEKTSENDYFDTDDLGIEDYSLDEEENSEDKMVKNSKNSRKMTRKTASKDSKSHSKGLKNGFKTVKNEKKSPKKQENLKKPTVKISSKTDSSDGFLYKKAYDCYKTIGKKKIRKWSVYTSKNQILSDIGKPLIKLSTIPSTSTIVHQGFNKVINAYVFTMISRIPDGSFRNTFSRASSGKSERELSLERQKNKPLAIVDPSLKLSSGKLPQRTHLLPIGYHGKENDYNLVAYLPGYLNSGQIADFENKVSNIRGDHFYLVRLEQSFTKKKKSRVILQACDINGNTINKLKKIISFDYFYRLRKQ